MRKNRLAFLAVILLSVLVLSFGVSLVAADSGYEDEFVDSSLSPFWTFVNPLGTSSYSLADHSGWLRITAPNGVGLGPGSNYNAPRILQTVTNNFEATTYVSGSFSQGGFRAGILLWKDIDNYMRIEKWGTDKVLMYGLIGGVERLQQANANYNSLHLKLEKSGTTISGHWSQDGITWISVQSFTFNAVDPVEVGLFVIDVGTVTFSADFDYFYIIPAGVFVVPEYPLGTIAIPIAMIGAFVIYKHKRTIKVPGFTQAFLASF